MSDFYIFGFGLLVPLIVGSGLATVIIAHNRALEQAETRPPARR